MDCNPVNMQTVIKLSLHLRNLPLCLVAPSDVPSAAESHLRECTLDSCLLALLSGCETLPVFAKLNYTSASNEPTFKTISMR